jgi:hypothetical protein
LSRPRKTLTTLIAERALHCGQLLDEIGHDTGMSNDTAEADGTIGSRVALDESEVDHQLAQDRYSNRALFGGRVIAIPLGTGPKRTASNFRELRARTVKRRRARTARGAEQFGRGAAPA